MVLFFAQPKFLAYLCTQIKYKGQRTKDHAMGQRFKSSF